MNSDSTSKSPTETMPHVGIVGAGISGLRSAEILLTHGFNVTILEARDRIGGRVSLYNYLILSPPRLTRLRSVRATSWAIRQICE